MTDAGLQTASFSMNDDTRASALPEGTFDGIIALATIERAVHIDVCLWLGPLGKRAGAVFSKVRRRQHNR